MPNGEVRACDPDELKPPPPGDDGCPESIVPTGPYACMLGVKNHAGRLVLVRYGRTGDGAFGYLHALIDHNLDLVLWTERIVPTEDGNNYALGRYSYYAALVPPKGEQTVTIKLVEDTFFPRDHNDGYETGILTGYCIDNSGQEESKCPNWVDEE